MRSRRSTHLVVLVGPLPPPVHGAARINEAIGNLLRDGIDRRVEAIGTEVRSERPRLLYHCRRMMRHAHAIFVVLRLSRWSSRRAVLLAAAGGAGLLYQLPVTVVAKALGYRVVIHHQSFAYITRRSRIMSAFAKVTRGGRGADHIVSCQRMADTFSAHYGVPAARMHVISNAQIVPLPRPRFQAATQSNQAVYLGHLANLTLDKGLDIVIEAFERCARMGLDVRLVLGGPCSDAYCKPLLESTLKTWGHLVEYRGPVDPKDVGDFMACLDIFLFPSRYRNETEPLVILEAQSAGAQVIATDVGCVTAMLLEEDAIADDSDFAEVVEAAVRGLLRSRRSDDKVPRRVATDRYDASALLQLLIGT